MQAPVWVVTQFPQFPEEPLLNLSFEEWYNDNNIQAGPENTDRKFLVFHSSNKILLLGDYRYILILIYNSFIFNNCTVEH